MKKIEAQMIAPEKSKLLLEYIGQFMSYDGVTGKILIDYDKDPETRQNMCYMEIMLDDGFERHFKTDITLDQSDVLSEQILTDIACTYASDDEVSISGYYSINSMHSSMHGIEIKNNKGSRILVDFLCRGMNFDKVVESYSNKIIEEQSRNKGISNI